MVFAMLLFRRPQFRRYELCYKSLLYAIEMFYIYYNANHVLSGPKRNRERACILRTQCIVLFSLCVLSWSNYCYWLKTIHWEHWVRGGDTPLIANQSITEHHVHIVYSQWEGTRGHDGKPRQDTGRPNTKPLGCPEALPTVPP